MLAPFADSLRAHFGDSLGGYECESSTTDATGVRAESWRTAKGKRFLVLTFNLTGEYIAFFPFVPKDGNIVATLADYDALVGSSNLSLLAGSLLI